MSNTPLTDLVMAAAQLKAAAPDYYSQMCDALRAYEVQAITEMVAADETHDLFRAQGKVRSVQQLRKHLTDSTQMRDTFTRRDANARPNA